VEVCLEHPLHNVALSSDELTLSVCGLSAEAALSITFYDVRTLMKQVMGHVSFFYFPNGFLIEYIF
jgi:hypothetical protein